MAYPKSLVIVPTYNEKENILLIMEAILKQNECLEILVVDDGSPDGTGDMVEAESAKAVRNFWQRQEQTWLSLEEELKS